MELGQPDFIHNSPNYVDLDVFNSPGQVAIDRTVSPNRLYVADTQNNRVLGYPSVSALVNGGPASLVIGQMDFFSGGCNPSGISRYTLCDPSAVAVDTAGNLFVADSGNNRVLQFNKPFTNASLTGMFAGQPASAVMGQLGNFTAGGCNFGCTGTSLCSATEQSLCNPSGVALDSANNVYILDQNNNRVLEIPAHSARPLAPIWSSDKPTSGPRPPTAGALRQPHRRSR